MRPEMRLGLVVFAMLVAAGMMIFFSMRGGEPGKVDIDNPNSSPTTASDQQIVKKPPTSTIPSNRSSSSSSTHSSPLSNPSGTSRPGSTTSSSPLTDSSPVRPSARPSDPIALGSPTRITPSAREEIAPSTSSEEDASRSSSAPLLPVNPRASRTSPELAVQTPEHSADDDTADGPVTTSSPLTIPSTRPSARENRVADATPSSSSDSSTSSTSSPITLPTRSRTEELKPVEERPLTLVRPTTAPSENTASPEQPATSGGRVHTVAPGERLWDLAEEAYGDGKYWGVIARANPKINPDRLLVGQKLNIPPRSAVGGSSNRTTSPSSSTTSSANSTRSAASNATSTASQLARATYTVERGDSLVKIADTLYADKDRWREIYELNKDKLKTPNVIRPGMKLKLPPLPN